MIFALIFAAVLLLIAVLSIRKQFDNLRRLRSESHIPSDDRRYLTNQARRRIVMGALLFVLAGMLVGTYFSGLDRRAEKAEAEKLQDKEAGEKKPMPEDDRAFIRFWGMFVIGLCIVLFLVISLAIVDIAATRRYAWAQLRRISTEHREVLERDLAMHRQQKLNSRMRGTK